MSSPYKSRKKQVRLSLWLKGIYGKLAKDLCLSANDRGYLLKRIDNEGLAFISRILPLYSKYMLACIEASNCNGSNPKLPTSFERGKDGAPIFLGLLFKSAVAGDSVDVLRIRQLCEYGYKIAMPYTDEQILKAEQKYEDVEDQVRAFEESNSTTLYNWDDRIRKIFETLYPNLVSASAADVLGLYRPRFGPGSFLENSGIVSELKRLAKYKLAGKAYSVRDKTANYIFENGYPLNRALHGDSKLTMQAAKRSPVDSFGGFPEGAKPYLGYFRSRPSKSSHKPSQSKSANFCKLAFVPKDSRGPRTISIEPVVRSSISLGFNDYLREAIEVESMGRVRFKDQSKHRELAREGSVKRNFATIDLESASDRVRYSLIRRMVRNAPALRWAIRLSRPSFVKFSKQDKILELRKFANMGNGLCFPFLSLSVQLSAIAGVFHFMPYLSLSHIAKQIWVYGDDLITPSEWLPYIYFGLEKSGLKVNKDKSFSKGPFRESCGGDYHNGNDVTPVRLRLNGLSLVVENAKIARKRVVQSKKGSSSDTINKLSIIPKKSLNSVDEIVMPTPDGGDTSWRSSRFHQCLTNTDGPDKMVVLLEKHCRELGSAQLWNLQSYYYTIIEMYLGRKLENVHPDSPYLGRVGTFDWNDNPIEGECKMPKPVLGTIHFTGACEDKALSRALKMREPLDSSFCDIPDVQAVNIINVKNVEATRLQYGLSDLSLIGL